MMSVLTMKMMRTVTYGMRVLALEASTRGEWPKRFHRLTRLSCTHHLSPSLVQKTWTRKHSTLYIWKTLVKVAAAATTLAPTPHPQSPLPSSRSYHPQQQPPQISHWIFSLHLRKHIPSLDSLTGLDLDLHISLSNPSLGLLHDPRHPLNLPVTAVNQDISTDIDVHPNLVPLYFHHLVYHS